MSNSPTPSANEPKRQRGRIRVAAIMEAGIDVFLEKGFDAATMTEIAARSGTAIGSLYRFFPSKASLADALLLQYTQQVESGLAELERNVSQLTPEGVADALVDFMLSLQSQRSLAITLVEERGDHDARRLQFREMLRGAMAGVLRKALPGLPLAKSRGMAVVVWHILKGIAGALQEKPAVRRMLLAEMRGLMRVYLASVQV
jgi:AcrR family transcriptional regulator